jgi:hypothetical protein
LQLRIFIFLFILLIAAMPLRAQNPDENPPPPSDLEILLKAESDIQVILSKRTMDEFDFASAAYRRLTGILQRQPDSPLRPRIEAALLPLTEIVGKHYLRIAYFYIDSYTDRGRKGHLKGAESRLLSIIKDYPTFSQMDEILFGVSTIALREDRKEDARRYLSQLICRYPLGAQVQPAFARLNEMGFGPTADCASLKQ